MTTQEIRQNKNYTFKHPVHVEAAIEGSFDGENYIGLNRLNPTDPVENALNGDDGEFQCWDAVISFVQGGLRIDGSDGPSGGDHNVVLHIPQDKIASMQIEKFS